MWKALVLSALLPQMVQAKPVRDLSVPLVAEAAYDRDRLVGAWYEVAQTPTFLEQDCHGTTVEVASRDDSRLTVRIACRKGALSGPVLPLEGVLVETDPGLFQVRFVRLAERGNLQLVLLWQAADDSMAVLGAPWGDVGWIWSKTPHPDATALEQAKAVLVAAGYRARAIRNVEQAR
ncbi:MAG: lipocalin family protein [Rhizobiaceae bacterium]